MKNEKIVAKQIFDNDKFILTLKNFGVDISKLTEDDKLVIYRLILNFSKGGSINTSRNTKDTTDFLASIDRLFITSSQPVSFDLLNILFDQLANFMGVGSYDDSYIKYYKNKAGCS